MMDAQELFNPFPGLRPFETDEYNLFFGREGQSDELLARLGRTRFLAVVGTSGSGKSSLVRAGLLPALYGGLMAGAGSGWRIALMRPGADPIGNLARALGEEGVLGSTDREAELHYALVETTLRRSTLGLVDAVRQARLADYENLLVVVDQFEELFRFKQARDAAVSTDDDAAAFVRALLEAAAQRELPVYVVLTMRSDFLGDCAQFWGLPEAINEGQYLIPRMTRDERRAAITGPVAVGGGRIASPLVNRLLNDMGDSPDQLPILQHALMRTWDFWAGHRRDGEPLGIEHYQSVGTMADALSRHAEEAFAELTEERQLIAEKIFKRLTEKGTDNRETRRPTPLRELCAVAEAGEGEVAAVVETFRREGRSFLVPPAGVELSPETVIDISHESLIRNWQRLKGWVNEEAQSARVYRRLAEAAVLHREGAEGLLNDPALQIALDWRDEARPNAAWAARYHPEFDTSVAYLDASREERDARLAAERDRDERELERTRAFAAQQARSAHRLRLLLAATAVMFLFALATAVYAMSARREALVLKEEAEMQRGQIAALLENEKVEKQRALEAEDRAEAQAALAETHRIEADKAKTKAVASERAAVAAQATAEDEKRKATAEALRATAALAKLNTEIENDHLNRDALATFQRGNMADAEGKLAQLLTTYRDDPQRQSWIYTYLGESRRKLGKLDEGIKTLGEALRLQEKAIGAGKLRESDPEFLDTITWLAHAHSDTGEYETAHPFYERALKIRQDALKRRGAPDGHADVGVSMENLARNYRNLGRLEEAERSYRAALESRRNTPGSPDLLATLKEAAEFYVEDLSKLDEAIALYREVLSFQEARLELDDPNIAETLTDMARVYEIGEAEGGAKRITELARAIRDTNILKKDSVNRDSALRNLAGSYAKLGKFTQAAQLHDRAYEMSIAREGPESKLSVYYLTNLAKFYHVAAALAREAADRQTFYAKAATAYGRALEISERKSYAEERLKALDGLAGLHLEQKSFAEAERFYKRALEIRELTQLAVDIQLSVVKGGHQAEMVVSLDGLARAAAGLGKHAEAEAHLLRARKTLAELPQMLAMLSGHNARTPSLRDLMDARLAEVYRQQGRVKEADELYRPLAGLLSKVDHQSLVDERTLSDFLEIIEKAGRFYTERGDDAAAESFYKYTDPAVLLYGLSKLPPFSCCEEDIFSIFDSYAALLGRTGREADAGNVKGAAEELRARLAADKQIP